MSSPTPKLSEAMPWLRLVVSDFVMDTQGIPLSQIGAYIRLMLLYWSGGNALPDAHAMLLRKVGATSDKDAEDVAAVLEEFFPMDDNGKRYHLGLDAQLAGTQGANNRRSEGVKKAWEARKGGSATQPTATSADPDF